MLTVKTIDMSGSKIGEAFMESFHSSKRRTAGPPPTAEFDVFSGDDFPPMPSQVGGVKRPVDLPPSQVGVGVGTPMPKVAGVGLADEPEIAGYAPSPSSHVMSRDPPRGLRA